MTNQKKFVWKWEREEEKGEREEKGREGKGGEKGRDVEEKGNVGS